MIDLTQQINDQLNEQLDEIIKQLQLMREEFVALEARAAAREEELCH